MCLAWAREADAAQLRVYQAALRDVPIDQISEAAGLLVRDATLRSMPTPGQWLEACEDVAATRVQQVKQLAAGVDAQDPVVCERCHDSGWAYYTKDGGDPMSCPPMGSHSDYVVRRCECRATNPRFIRKHVPPKVPKYTSKRKPREPKEKGWYDRD